MLLIVLTSSLLCYKVRKMLSGNHFQITGRVQWSCSQPQFQHSWPFSNEVSCSLGTSVLVGKALWVCDTLLQAGHGVPGELCVWEGINLLMPLCSPRCPLLPPCLIHSLGCSVWYTAGCSLWEWTGELYIPIWIEVQKIYLESCRYHFSLLFSKNV